MAEKKERFEMLLEEIRDKVKLALEGHDVIRSEMRQMEGRLSEKISIVDGKVEHLGREFREMKQKVDKIDSTLEEHVRLPAHA